MVGLLSALADLGTISAGMGVIYIARQAKTMREAHVDDHERSRRKAAHDLICRVTAAQSREASSCRNLVEALDDGQLVRLRAKEGFLISKEHEKFLIKALENCEPDKSIYIYDGDKIRLDEFHSSHIYNVCITYLNNIETALIAWDVAIASSDIVEEQLTPLFKPRSLPAKQVYLLENIRRVIGQDAYPCIARFVQKISTKEEDKPLVSDCSPLAQKG